MKKIDIDEEIASGRYPILVNLWLHDGRDLKNKLVDKRAELDEMISRIDQAFDAFVKTSKFLADNCELNELVVQVLKQSTVPLTALQVVKLVSKIRSNFNVRSTHNVLYRLVQCNHVISTGTRRNRKFTWNPKF